MCLGSLFVGLKSVYRGWVTEIVPKSSKMDWLKGCTIWFSEGHGSWGKVIFFFFFFFFFSLTGGREGVFFFLPKITISPPSTGFRGQVDFFFFFPRCLCQWYYYFFFFTPQVSNFFFFFFFFSLNSRWRFFGFFFQKTSMPPPPPDIKWCTPNTVFFLNLQEAATPKTTPGHTTVLIWFM